eukprot:Gb_17014 [translate_table: standard]
MYSLRRKRKGGAAVDDAETQQLHGFGDDGVSCSSLASHLSFEECWQQRKRRKEKKRDEELGSRCLHPTAAATAPPLQRGSRGCLPSPPGRGLKRKVGCIEAATQTGRNRKLETDYFLGPELGQGKFGLVRLCRNKVTGEELACKTLPKKGEENVHKEVEIMQHLSGHPSVVTLRAVYEDADSLHLVMELCAGGRLLDEMSKNGCYPEHQAAKLLKDVILVIKYCHEMGVVHRDIKPENILRTAAGHMKLADFGLSMRVTNGQSLSGVVGSPAYVAPEVLLGTYTEKVDVWGAGVLLHALLIGVLPFRGDSVEAIFEAIKEVQLDFRTEKWQSVSGPAKDLLSRMLSRDVAKRLSPEEVLSHPWIMFYTESTLKLDASKSKKKKRARNHCSVPIAKGNWFEESVCTSSSYAQERREVGSVLTGCKEVNSYSEDSQRPSLPDGAVCSLPSFCPPPSRDNQPQGECTLVDALAAAITQIRISEPKRSRLCAPPCPVEQQCSSNMKINLCTAF